MLFLWQESEQKSKCLPQKRLTVSDKDVTVILYLMSKEIYTFIQESVQIVWNINKLWGSKQNKKQKQNKTQNDISC